MPCTLEAKSLAKSYTFTSETLEKFKDPFGELFEGTFEETATQLKRLITQKQPPMIISVGDIVSKNLVDHDIFPKLAITDNQTLRKEIPRQSFQKAATIHIKNPQGTVTQEAIDAIEKALQSSEQTHLIVEGEEDLLTLIAVLYASEGAFVIYGQPSRGMVVIEVTKKKKTDAKKIWKQAKQIS
jgi:GTP-dependent dephospho-CoA kinase